MQTLTNPEIEVAAATAETARWKNAVESVERLLAKAQADDAEVVQLEAAIFSNPEEDLGRLRSRWAPIRERRQAIAGEIELLEQHLRQLKPRYEAAAETERQAAHQVNVKALDERLQKHSQDVYDLGVNVRAAVRSGMLALPIERRRLAAQTGALGGAELARFMAEAARLTADAVALRSAAQQLEHPVNVPEPDPSAIDPANVARLHIMTGETPVGAY